MKHFKLQQVCLSNLQMQQKTLIANINTPIPIPISINP